MSKILIISDAYVPQVNGVVRTLNETIRHLQDNGHEVEVISPADFPNLPLPGYPEIRVPRTTRGLARMMEDFEPNAVHIAVEGRLGIAARKICLENQWRFTTAFHTDFPGYFKRHLGLSPKVTFAYMRWFHKASSAVLVSTKNTRQALFENGITHTRQWGRGVDRLIFRPRQQHDSVPRALHNAIQPVLLYVGRVSIEKNIEAFLDLDIEGTKVIVGDGPALQNLTKRYPDVDFLGERHGTELGAIFAAADCFVFPSRTDTFGLVMAEAMACGTPVAAFPVPGPLDVVGDGGALSEDLSHAITRALMIDRTTVEQASMRYNWSIAGDEFFAGLVDIKTGVALNS